jgi:hypothetical protein
MVLLFALSPCSHVGGLFGGKAAQHSVESEVPARTFQVTLQTVALDALESIKTFDVDDDYSSGRYAATTTLAGVALIGVSLALRRWRVPR